MTEIWAVPGFTHVRELGESDTGRVVQAVDDVTRTQVAIRYVDDRLRHDERFKNRFGEHARLLGRLEDPNLVQLYEYAESPEAAAVIMELVDGVSLAQLLNAYRPTGPLPALAVFSGSLMGLATLHENGVEHGCYRPSSVLVTADGTVKLTDAAVFGYESTGDRYVPRNAPYLAPERWDGTTPPGVTDDLYAATAVFYECLTGRPPFRARTLSGMAKAHRSESISMEAVPEPLRELVSSGLAKTPGERPASAADLLAALDDAATAAYGSTWDTDGKDKLAALATEAIASSASSATSGSASRAGSSRSGASSRRRGRARSLIGVAIAAVVISAVGYGVSQSFGADGGASSAHNSASATPAQPSVSPVMARPTRPPDTSVSLADAIGMAAAEKRNATFVHRHKGCCGIAATAARGAFSFVPSAPSAYDAQIWSTVRNNRYARRTRTILVDNTAYVAGAGGWRPAPATLLTPAERDDATRTYASIAAQTRWGTSMHGVLALLRSANTFKRDGLIYTGTAPVATLTRDGFVGPLYAQFAARGGTQVTFKLRVDGNLYLPHSLQITMTPQGGGQARTQVFTTLYSRWGRTLSITAPQ